MKVSVGTNTNENTNTKIEINDYKFKKKLSLKPLYMPYYRLNLLFAKTLLLKHTLNNNFDFSNKSIFIYPLKKQNILEFENKKSNSMKNIYASKLRTKKIINTNSFKRNLSTNESINDNNNKIIDIKNNDYILSAGNINNLKKTQLKELYFSQTTRKMNLHLYSPIKRNNLFGINKKLNFNSEKKMNESKDKSKIKFVKFFNKKLNFIINGKKGKRYKLKNSNK